MSADCGCCCQPSLPCGCCAGMEPLTPLTVANRPGLNALTYRAGTHGSFLEAMLARLAVADVEPSVRPLAALTERSTDDPSIALLDAWASVADVLSFYTERIANEGYLRTATERRSVLELARQIGYELRPGVAATTYLAFTLEDGFEVQIPAGTRAQSVPRPGELAESFETAEPLPARWLWNALRPRLTIPVKLDVLDVSVLWLAGTETALTPGDLLLLVDESVSPPRVGLVRVNLVEADTDDDRTRVGVGTVTLEGAPAPGPRAATAALRRAVPDPGGIRRGLEQAILVDLDPDQFQVSKTGQVARRVLRQLRALIAELAAEPAAHDLTAALQEHYLPTLRAELDAAHGAAFRNVRRWLEAGITRLEHARAALAAIPAPISPFELGPQLLEPPSQPPPSRLQLEPTLAAQFAAGGDVPLRAHATLQPGLAGTLLPAWQTTSTPAGRQQILALRERANLFGFNAPKQVTYDDNTGNVKKPEDWSEWPVAGDENATTMFLDAAYPTVTPGSRIVVQKPPKPPAATPVAPVVFTAQRVQVRPRSAYNLSDTVTVLELDRAWWNPSGTNPDKFEDVIRGTTVHLGAEPLVPAERPLGEVFPDPQAPGRIPLDGLYGDLEPGRWLVVSGERLLGDPRPGEEGTAATVAANELVMLAGVKHGLAANGELPGDTPHTTLTLASPLKYRYRRRTVLVSANVAKSSHGETVAEVLGSGDGSAELLRFELTSSPLTHVAAVTPTGVRSTLEVRVNGVRWNEARSLLDLGPADRGFIARADDGLVTRMMFGDGRFGSRVPTGLDNVEARYRFRIGRPGNVGAGRITMLATIPEGVRSVVNPLPATGGGDPESRDEARTNAPRSVTALDRLVSVQDYEDFARTFAGIGEALAVRRSDGRRRLVHVTVAGSDDAPIDPSSDTFRNLLSSLRAFGDPGLPLRVEPRELLLIVVEAGIGIHPDHRFDQVEPAVRAALLDAFGFARRRLGQDVVHSQVQRTIQAVPGVTFVDLDVLGVVGEAEPDEILGLPAPGQAPPARIPVYPPTGVTSGLSGAFARAAQLAIVSPNVPETVLLKELR
jgi:predicted phage baseplate assembly protein